MPPITVPPIITNAAALMQRYEVIFCDVWGVIHDGHNAFTEACDALIRFRQGGGTVILLSNAPVPTERVAVMLDRCAVPEEAWDDIVPSGEIALQHIAERGYMSIYYIGPFERDRWTFSRLAGTRAMTIEAADAILCTGLDDDLNETADDYRALLERAHARKLPFVCANPDLVVDVGGRQYLCAGAIGDLYERMDGDVFWAGKPHINAYEAARKRAEAIRGAPVSFDGVLAVGDSLRTDLKGAETAGIDAIFVASGIHRDETMGEEAVSAEKLAVLFAPPAPPAVAVMSRLTW